MKMKIETLVRKVFYEEWSVLRGYSQPGPYASSIGVTDAKKDFARLEASWKRVFDFDAVQNVVDEDMEKLDGRHREVRKRYHGNNLRFLSRNYAQQLYIVSDFGDHLSEEAMKKALEDLKIAWSCPIYPCQRR